MISCGRCLGTDRLWSDWADHYRSLGIDEGQITRDGAPDPVAYGAASPRVVFALKDSNDWPGHCLCEGMLPPIRMMIMVARWSYGVLNDFPPIEEADRPSNQAEAIRRVAAFNLKKAAGGARCVEEALLRFVHQDGELLRRQFADLAPQVVIACGTWRPLLTLLRCESAIGSGTDSFRDPQSRALLVKMRHPAMAGRITTYERLRGLIRDARAAGSS